MNNWQGLYGHPQIKNFLDKLNGSDSTPQALLFFGKSGVGKDFFAFRFAENSINISLNKIGEPTLPFESMVDKGLIRMIYALPRGKNEDSDDDPLIKLTTKELENIKEEQKRKISNPYYDLQIAGANQIKINSIRDVIRVLSLNRDYRQKNFVIILDADLMRVEAQNSLLKMLEEPPPNTTFILTTSRLEFIAETIRSRSWMVNFGILFDEEISKILEEYFDIEPERFRDLLPLANGSVSHMMNILSGSESDIRELVIEFLRNTMAAKFNSGYKLLEEFTEGESSRLILLIDLVSIWFRDLTRFRIGNDDLYYKEFVSAFEKFDSRYKHIGTGNIHKKLEYYRNILSNTNVNQSVVSFNLIFALADLIYNFNQKK